MKNFIFCFVLILFSCKPTDQLTPDLSTLGVDYEGPEQSKTWTEEFMILVNDHRISLGMRPLTHDESLGDIAQVHSSNMAQGVTSFGHTGFSSRCSQGKTALGGGNWCAENVAMGQKTPSAAFKSWMNSSGHRANIEKSRGTHAGFGYAKSSGGTYYWTQIFIERN